MHHPTYKITHTTAFITPVVEHWLRKEVKVLFNDALSTFYSRLYDVARIIKDRSDNERGNPLPTHGLLFLFSSKGSFICAIPQTGSLAGMRNSSMGPPRRIDPTTHRVISERSYPLPDFMGFAISSKGSFICTGWNEK